MVQGFSVVFLTEGETQICVMFVQKIEAGGFEVKSDGIVLVYRLGSVDGLKFGKKD